ncbi:MAG: DNA repair protein RecN [candidate division Zixibacteria bacterium RBG_16_53_22]|nr:MAG: DNA repair protein RecN [candidate division Zixibacteria bacterium RBG_16_53_22]
MLARLHIENFALIDNLDIEFGEDLNVLTGATGAGKSIIVGALDIILGGRGSEEIIRTGADSCIVEAEFRVLDRHFMAGLNDSYGINLDGDSLIIRREYKRRGGGRAFIESSQVPVSTLKDIAGQLADILGQHSHQTLLDPATHCSYLDQFAGLENKVDDLRALYNRAAQLRDELLASDKIAREIGDRIDLLTFQINEIERSKLKSGEEERLREERKLLENSRRIREAADWAVRSIQDEEGSAVDKIGQAEKSLGAIAETSEAVKKIIDALKIAADTLGDSVMELKNLVERLDVDPARLEEINDRLAELFRLKKKYGPTIDDILAYMNKSAAEMDDLKARQADSKTIQERYDKSIIELNRLAAEISAARNKAVPQLEKLVIEKLIQMGVPKAQFVIRIGYADNEKGLYEINGRRLAGDAIGFDIIEFQFCANPGEGLKPLARIASGGEISRVMLALKNAFLKKKETACEVFDEIDVGISGEVATKVGRQLKELSRKHQVICITHLAQIASMADHHFRVFKSTSRGRAVTRVQPLDRKERVREIASLISGEKITQKSIAGAEELLASAGDAV